MPDEIVIRLEPAVPPLWISSVPPTSVAPLAVPPDETSSWPPLLTIVPLA